MKMKLFVTEGSYEAACIDSIIDTCEVKCPMITKGKVKMINFTKAAKILRHIKNRKFVKGATSLVVGMVSCAFLMGFTTSNSPIGDYHISSEKTIAAGVDLVPGEEAISTTAQTTSTVTTCTTSTSATTTTGIITTTSSSTSITDTTVETEPTTTTTEEPTTTSTEETTEVITTMEVATTVEEPTTTATEEATREYVVYKPSTHYIHRNTCHWVNAECYEIENTEGFECRRCSECNPDMDIVSEYVIQQTTVNNGDGYYSLNFITEDERIYLCNTVGTEYGSDWVSLYDKACVVATIMNRVHDGGWTNGNPSTVYNVLTAPYQYNPNYAVPYYRSNVTQSCIDAVEYYFEHQEDFPHYTSFWGDGTYNYFR